MPTHERTLAGRRAAEALPLDCQDLPPESHHLETDCFDDAPAALVLLRMDGRLTAANQAFLDLSGQTAQSARDFLLQQILPPAGRIFFETQVIPVLLLNGVVNELALDIVHLSGERIPVLANANLRRDSAGVPCGIVLALLEIKARRQYERELLNARKGDEQIAEIVRRSSDAILTISPAGIIQSWNKGAEQMFSWTQEEAVGSSFESRLFHSNDSSEVRQVISLLSTGQEVTKDLAGFAKDGRQLDLSISFTPHMEAPGVLVAFSAIIRDITIRKRTEQALIQSEKLASVGRLASSIAHEINNPLESLTNLLFILESELADPEASALVHTAQEELARVSQIVTHTLRFHRQSTHRTEVNVRSLFQSVLALYRARLVASGISVDLTQAHSCSLLCYDGELRQILANLIGNAFEAMRAGGGRVILRCRSMSRRTPGVRITIADTGVGMAPATLRRAFEPFFTTRGAAGTGLGLWITQELVTKNGGKIQVRSRTGPAKSGTVFVMTFPDTNPTPDLRHAS